MFKNNFRVCFCITPLHLNSVVGIYVLLTMKRIIKSVKLFQPSLYEFKIRSHNCFYVSFFSAIEFNSQSHSLVLRVLLSMKWIEVNHISNKHDFYIVCDTCMISQCLTSLHNTFIVNIEPTCMYLLWHRRHSSIWRHRIGIVSVSTSWQHCTHFPVYFAYIIYIAKMLSEDMKSISTLSSVLS